MWSKSVGWHTNLISSLIRHSAWQMLFTALQHMAVILHSDKFTCHAEVIACRKLLHPMERWLWEVDARNDPTLECCALLKLTSKLLFNNRRANKRWLLLWITFDSVPAKIKSRWWIQSKANKKNVYCKLCPMLKICSDTIEKKSWKESRRQSQKICKSYKIYNSSIWLILNEISTVVPHIVIRNPIRLRHVTVFIRRCKVHMH